MFIKRRQRRHRPAQPLESQGAEGEQGEEGQGGREGHHPDQRRHGKQLEGRAVPGKTCDLSRVTDMSIQSNKIFGCSPTSASISLCDL